jgi:hypothetical protein
MAGNLAVVACPGGPVVKTYVGRTPPKNEAPLDLLPSPFDPVPKMIARFADMGFSVRELMALIGAHTTGKQRFVDINQATKSFDSTVDVWDVRFYSETQAATAAPGMLKFGLTAPFVFPNACSAGTFRLNSDVNFSHNTTTVKDYNRFVGKQDDWYAAWLRTTLVLSNYLSQGSGIRRCAREDEPSGLRQKHPHRLHGGHAADDRPQESRRVIIQL